VLRNSDEEEEEGKYLYSGTGKCDDEGEGRADKWKFEIEINRRISYTLHVDDVLFCTYVPNVRRTWRVERLIGSWDFDGKSPRRIQSKVK